MTVVPCIVCGKELSDIGSGSPNHADHANEFRTRGQYGSTVFDPINDEYLAVNICDKCIVEAQKLNRVLLGHKGKPDLEPWSRS